MTVKSPVACIVWFLVIYASCAASYGTSLGTARWGVDGGYSLLNPLISDFMGRVYFPSVWYMRLFPPTSC